MTIPPLPRINHCPNCGAFPEPRRLIWHRKFGFSPMGLLCGECGTARPLVKDGEWQHQRAYAAWGRVFGQPEPPRPPVKGSGVRAVS
jgi:hypothetical protein